MTRREPLQFLSHNPEEQETMLYQDSDKCELDSFYSSDFEYEASFSLVGDKRQLFSCKSL